MPGAGYSGGAGTSGGGGAPSYGVSPLAGRGTVKLGGSSGGSGPAIQPGDTGRYSIDISGPGGVANSLQKNDQATTDFIAGLGEALFGEKTGLVSGIPVVGGAISGAVRGISAIPGVGAPAAAVSGVFGAVGNVLSRIPTGWLPGGADQMFAALPDSAEKRAVEAAANADVLYGGNMKYDYVQKMMSGRPSLFPEIATGPAGSLGGLGVQLLSVLGIPQRLVERTITNVNGRLDEIARLAPADRSPVEQTVADNLASGAWTQDQAKDYLSSHAAGLSHDPFVEIVGSFLTDPTVIAGFGSGILTKAARGAKLAGEAGKEASTLGKIALAAQGSDLGPLFRGARTVIDPMSALGRTNLPPKTVDLLADKTVFSMAAVAYGEKALVEVRDLGDELGLTDKFFGNLRDGIANLAREHAGNQLGDAIRLVGAKALSPQAMAQLPPAEKIDMLARNQTRIGAQEFLARLTRVRAANTDVEDIAARMAVTFGRTADDYKAALTAMSDDARAALHMATYDKASAGLDAVIQREMARVAGNVDEKFPLDRLVVHNLRRLDEGAAKGVINGLKAALKAGKHAQLEALQNVVATYDNVGGLLRINEADLEGSIKRAIEKLDDMIARQDLMRVPGADELKKYPELKLWAETHQPFGLAFRPPDERLWQVAMDTEGIPAMLNPWVGHAVGDGTSAYRPGFNLPRNLVGVPVVDPLARRLQKPLDWLEVGANALRPAISGQAIRQDWRQRFTRISAERYGMSPDESGALIDAIEKRAGMDDWSQSVRGMSGRNMWKAITEEHDLRPATLRVGDRFTKRDLVHLVLEAFEGDMRYVGLTQAFTGRMKTVLATKGPLTEFAGGNFAGQVSEKFYPMVRFLFHPMFQAQEAFEGPFFSVLRGIRPRINLSGKLSEAEKETAKAMQNLQDFGIVRLFEMGDMTEFSIKAQQGYGRLAQIVEALPDSGIRLADTGEGLTFIARQKYINYLALWRHHLAGLRDVVPEETWLALKKHYGIADDSEMAVKYLSEMMSDTMDVVLTPEGFSKFDQNIRNIDLWKPSAQGAMTPIGLDYVARSLGYDHAGALRAKIESGETSVEAVQRTIKDHYNASDEYLNRLGLALKFDVGEFFRGVRDAYGLDRGEYMAFRTMMENSARLRGLTPAEYLSSIFAPNVAKAERADIVKSAAVKDSVALLRVPKRAKGSQADVLYTELARAFRPHMDPSGLDVLRKASGIKGRWGVKHDQWLGAQMRAYVEGRVSINFAAPTIEPSIRLRDAPMVQHITLDKFDKVGAPGIQAYTPGTVVETEERGRVRRSYVPNHVFIYRGSDGTIAGALSFDVAADGKVGSIMVAVDEPFRRQGIATKLYDAAAARGYNILAASGAETTALGAAFSSAYRARRAAAYLNPDVERALQWMGRWTSQAADHIGAGSPEFADIVARTTKMDTSAGVPYNFTEHLAWQAVVERLKLMEDDAYRTHYFKRSRTVLERSLNHPFFALYPASYMWGKVLPELINFIAREPFGIRTGAAAYAFNDIYKTMAAQRELDPEFDKEIEKIGKTPAAFMLGYMLPAVPYDIPAVLPGWARELANQGIANKQRRDRGLPTKDIAAGEALKKITDYLSPLAADTTKVNQLGKQAGDTLAGPVDTLNTVAENATSQLISTLFGQ